MIRPSFHSSPAFLARAIDLGEADRRLTFFTRDAGVLVTVGKSAWRSRKRFGGTLQRYVLLDIAWTERPGRMAVLSSASVNRSFWGIVEDWERVRHADHLLEIASELFPQAGPKPRAFEALLRGMGSIAGGEPPPEVALKVEAELLAIGGWGPNLYGCRKCGGMESRSYRFLSPEGGIVCGGCPPEGGFPLSLGAVKTWRALQAGEGAGRSRLRIPVAIAVELRSIIHEYLEYCIGKRLRSLAEKRPSSAITPQFSNDLA